MEEILYNEFARRKYKPDGTCDADKTRLPFKVQLNVEREKVYHMARNTLFFLFGRTLSTFFTFLGRLYRKREKALNLSLFTQFV